MTPIAALARGSVVLVLTTFSISCGKKADPKVAAPEAKGAIPGDAKPKPPLFANLPDCVDRRMKIDRPKCWTLEKGDNDAFIGFAKRLNPVPGQHFNSELAIENLVACVNEGERDPVLIGHGRPGLICTGNGAGCWSSNPVKLSIEDGNGKFWDEWFAKTKTLRAPPSTIRLVSCNTGAGPNGAEFLNKLANRFHCTVKAWTYFVWADATDIWLDPDGDWETAEPGPDLPAVKNGPTVTSDPGAAPVLFANDSQAQLGPGSLQVTSFSDVQQFGQTASFDMPVDPQAGNTLAGLGNLSKPCYTGAAPASMTELKLILESKPDTPVKVRKEFALLSGDVLQDRDYPDVYYRVDSQFKQVVANVVSRYRETHHMPP